MDDARNAAAVLENIFFVHFLKTKIQGDGKSIHENFSRRLKGISLDNILSRVFCSMGKFWFSNFCFAWKNVAYGLINGHRNFPLLNRTISRIFTFQFIISSFVSYDVLNYSQPIFHFCITLNLRLHFSFMRKTSQEKLISLEVISLAMTNVSWR